MATIPIDLYVLNSELRLGLSPSQLHLPPAPFPIPTNGDVWALKVRYYDEGVEHLHRYIGSSTRARFRAQGNNTVYADSGLTNSEIIPAAPAVTHAQVGGVHLIEEQAVAFDVSGGTFTLTFVAPPSTNPDGYFPMGTTPPIPAGASAGQIQTIIYNSIRNYYLLGGVVTTDPVAPRTEPGPWAFGINRAGQTVAELGMTVGAWTQYKGFTVFLGSTSPAAGNNQYSYPLPLVQLDSSNLIGSYGWNVNLPLDGNGHTFSDLFLAVNKPAYLEVLLAQAGQTEQYAALELFPSLDSPPVFQNGPPLDHVASLSSPYNFIYLVTGNPLFSVTAGALPPGLSLSSAGLISGSPTTAGTFVGTVTATNSGGSATQDFIFTINSTPGGGGGPGGPALSVILDGLEFTIAKPSGDLRFSQHDPAIPNSLIVRQEFSQLRASFGPQAIGSTISLNGQTWYLIEETELRDLGGGFCSWDRVYATIPSSYTIYSAIPKTIKYLFTVWVNGAYATANIVSTTKTVRCAVAYDYGLSVAALPGVPDAVLYPGSGNASSVWLVDGWPVPTAAAPNSNNEGQSFIQGDVGTYMGPIKFRKQIFGPA